MHRVLTAALVSSLVLAGCSGGDDPPGTNGRGPGSPPVSPGAPPGTVELPSPSFPPEGGTPAVDYEVEATRTERVGDRGYPSTIVLIRTPQEARTDASQLPPAAAQLATGWPGYGERSLIFISGGTQTDASTTLKLLSVAVRKNGKRIETFVSVQAAQGPAQGASVPWVAVSVNAAATVLAQKCVLQFEGGSPHEFRC